MPIEDLPALPDAPAAETLRELDDNALSALLDELTALERGTVAAMSPFERRAREIRARAAEIATERRRRERGAHASARAAIRQQAKSGALPSLADALAAEPSPLPDELQLAALSANLASGGSVGLGYPTRPGQMSFTDGRTARSATTWGEARQMWADGWEPGTASVPGVRVHLTGTRVERVVPADEVVLTTA